MLLGAHVSISGGTPQAFARAAELGVECLQIFTRNQQQWKVQPVRVAEARAFRAGSEQSAIPLEHVMAHASYLINVASPDREKLGKSRRALLAEVRRCEKLGISLLNLHPGAHKGSGEETGIARAIESLDRVVDVTRGSPVRIVLETTAGGGSCLGYRFEHLAAILEGVEEPNRFAVCLDTAHVHAAGYDMTTRSRYQKLMGELETLIGLERLVAFHLNDSKVPLGSRKDRHEEIGKGYIGETAFRLLLADPRHRDAIGVLELGPDLVPRNLERLRSFCRRPA